jgi:tRNA(Ile)-lysidine synthase TilS/MesJ
MEKYQEIERSIIKKYRREIWNRFIDAVVQYRLIQEDDRIAVCMSGGKDSMLMAKCMQELQRHGKYRIGLEFLVMDPGYNPTNRQRILDNAALLDIPIKVFETRIFDIVASVDGSPCYLCARMRRGHLYSRARELGCNKIALGHHFDDVIETLLLSMFYGAEFKGMMPKLRSANFGGMELIRPMYMVREADILKWKTYHALDFIQCACRFTENCALSDGGVSKRQEMKALIKRLRQTSPGIDQNIFNSAQNVNLNTVIAYRDADGKHSFLDTY